MTTPDSKNSPMMAQWKACKEEAKDALLFFRLGDFYEAFYEDAETASKELDLTLTQRQQVPMSGIPAHTLDAYVDKLLQKGHKVAIADQIEDAKKSKGLVKREITKILTPGTVVSSTLLSEKSNNYICSLNQVGQVYGLSFLDLSTSELKVTELESIEEIQNELYRFSPTELLISNKCYERNKHWIDQVKENIRFRVESIEDWRFEHQMACGYLTKAFKVHSLDGFGMKGMVAAINSAGALLAHVQETLRHPLESLQSIELYSNRAFMALDRSTLRNLELVESVGGNKKQTLLAILDFTETAMGARTLKKWVLHPLLELESIEARQDAVQELLGTDPFELTLRDLERIAIKISAKYASPKDLLALKQSLGPLELVHAWLKLRSAPLFQSLAGRITPFPELKQLLENAISDDPPFRLNDGGTIRSGYNAELDELRELSTDSKEWMEQYQTAIRESSGIKTLKVGFTRVSGFYIEISKGQADKAPSHFIRRQTLTNAERFITPELKSYEEKILHAEEKALAIEVELFEQIRNAILEHLTDLLESAKAVGELDALQSLAKAARAHRFCRPKMDRTKNLLILEGRHPVIESTLLHEPFTPNSCILDGESEKMMLITGPNMSGKSTFIRQTALIVLMAHIGSYVPAERAQIGLVDKIFTRIGANDDLSRGQSTFMVEMTETAAILNNATDRSLVILDEIGRGTSTYDGIS
ncbi:MAG: DNA mismatch repair protein MutS, partial [Parachlamydiaceae bacterium]